MRKHKKIANYARMCSNEAHEEWMAEYDGHTRDLISEMIDKFDWIEAMATDNLFKKIMRKVKYGNRG